LDQTDTVTRAGL